MAALNSTEGGHGLPLGGDREQKGTGDLAGDQSGEPDQKRFTLSALGSRDASKVSVSQGPDRSKNAKPWETRRKSQSINPKIRAKLPTIESYDKEVVCTPHAAPKVMVRLERVTGSDRVHIKNYKYLNMLSKRITEEEEKLLGKTHKRRRDEELRRYRDLVIAGEIEPHEGMEDLTTHPVYRVNRIMRRLNAMKFSHNDSLNPRITPLKLTPTEPFSAYEKTGILFGFHPNHYLKTGGIYPESERSTSTTSTNIPPESTEIPETAPEEADIEEWGGEDYISQEEEEPVRPATSLTLTPQLATDLCSLLRRSSMSLASRYLGVDLNDKQLKLQRTRIVEEFMNTHEPGGQTMYDFASGISGAMKRTQAKGDDFCIKTHRKLFT